MSSIVTAEAGDGVKQRSTMGFAACCTALTVAPPQSFPSWVRLRGLISSLYDDPGRACGTI